MSFWDFLDGLLRNTPSALALALLALLVSHAFKIILQFFEKRPQSNALVITLETLVVIVLSYLAFHVYLGRHLGSGESPKWAYEPFATTCLLVGFTCWSLRLYTKYKARAGGARR